MKVFATCFSDDSTRYLYSTDDESVTYWDIRSFKRFKPVDPISVYDRITEDYAGSLNDLTELFQGTEEECINFVEMSKLLDG